MNTVALPPRLAPSNDFEKFEKDEIFQGIHQRFEKQVLKHGASIAVKEPERCLTYAELNTRANCIARAILQKVGSERGQIAFVLPNGPLAIATIFGIMKAGKCYVPLDPLFPEDRTAYMFEHSEAKLIVTDREHRDLANRISSGASATLLLEEIDFEKPAENPNLKIDAESAAYILYTSGSTGKPKGIAFSHRNLLHTTMCLINNLHISSKDRLTQMHSTSFAASVVDIYCSLLNGASVYPWDVKSRGIKGLAEWLTSEKITALLWIPTPFRQLVETLGPGSFFSSVRLVVMASEPLTRREFDLFRNHFPNDCFLVNQMGTSESYNYYLFFARKDTVFDGSIVPAGYPVSDEREVLLLDEQHKEVKPGEIGEIAIRSEFMSLGYWRSPDLTSKVFLSDSGTKKQMYLTGDIGRRLENGCLLHLGRRDFQVKIRGYRIELPEVELAIKSLEHIRDVAVMARPDQKGEMKLVGYYIAVHGKDISVPAFRRGLASRLPEYMIPNLYVRMEEFPMTPSGKMDKNSLPAPDDVRPTLENEMVAARNSTEETLTAIWKEVLGFKSVGVSDNFFELGGDSLQAAQVLHLTQVRLGVDLGYSALVQAPTVADMARMVEERLLKPHAPAMNVEGVHQERGAGENILRGIFNRLLQVLALYAPGLTSLRVWMHRLRGVHIGDNVAIGTAAIIETAHPELVWIGDNVAIGIRNVIIGHFSDSIDRNRMGSGPTVRICNNVYIGPNVTILPNVTVGEGSVIAAGSVVNKSIPPRTMVQGNPARAIAICEVPLVGENRTYEDFLKHLRPVSGAE